MGPMPRRTRNAVNSHRKKNVAARKKPAVDKCCNNIKGGHTLRMKPLQLSESCKSHVKNENMGCSRAVLRDTTNKSPAARNRMALRTRKNVKYDSGLDSSSSATSADLSYDLKVIRSPRSNKLNKKCYSMKNVDVLQIPVFKNSFVLLENIDESLEKKMQTSPESSDHQKTCVYKNTQNTDENFKPVGDMLPEEKLALYEFEVDENEPKQVKKPRKRKPRIKRPHTSDSEQSPLMSVVKQMRHLTTSNTNKDQNIKSACHSSLSVCKHNKSPQDSQFSKQSTSKANVAYRPILVQRNTNFETPPSVKISLSISPIEKSGHKQIVYSPKTVRFANNYPPANSTPHTPVSFRKTDQTSASPDVGTPTFKLKSARNRGVSSIYVRPNSNVHHKFVLDDSICSENEEPTQESPKTPPNIRELTPGKRHDRFRQTSIQHFLDTSTVNETNISNKSAKTNLDASGLFDETSNSAQDQVPQSSRNLSLSFPSFVTMRKKYQFNHLNNSIGSSTFFNDTSDSQRESLEPRKKLNATFDNRPAVHRKYTYVPRISSFEPRDSPSKSGEKLTLENCFGFDDNESEDGTAAPLRTANCKNRLPASSTPYCSNVQSTQPRPARISVQELKEMLAPIVAKKPVHPRPSLQATSQSLTPTPVQSLVSSIPTNPQSLPVSLDLNQSQSTSPTMLFSESKVLTPVFFADDTPSEYFSKPARKSYGRSTRTKRSYYTDDGADEDETPEKIPKKKKRHVKVKEAEVDNWVADINSHFNEIEGMELCVE